MVKVMLNTYIAFYKTHSGLGLALSTAYNGSYLAVANDDSTLIFPDYRFPSKGQTAP